MEGLMYPPSVLCKLKAVPQSEGYLDLGPDYLDPRSEFPQKNGPWVQIIQTLGPDYSDPRSIFPQENGPWVQIILT